LSNYENINEKYLEDFCNYSFAINGCSKSTVYNEMDHEVLELKHMSPTVGVNSASYLLTK